jgi:hypothetical protein
MNSSLGTRGPTGPTGAAGAAGPDILITNGSLGRFCPTQDVQLLLREVGSPRIDEAARGRGLIYYYTGLQDLRLYDDSKQNERPTWPTRPAIRQYWQT